MKTTSTNPLVTIALVLMLAVFTGTCLAQQTNAHRGPTTITLRGRTVEGITSVKLSRKDGSVVVLWPGGGGMYKVNEFPQDFLSAWRISRDEVDQITSLRSKDAEAKAEAKAKQRQEYVNSFQGLGDVASLEKWMKGSKMLGGAFKRRTLQQYCGTNISVIMVRGEGLARHGDPISFLGEQRISHTLPILVCTGTTQQGNYVMAVSAVTNLVRLRVVGVLGEKGAVNVSKQRWLEAKKIGTHLESKGMDASEVEEWLNDCMKRVLIENKRHFAETKQLNGTHYYFNGWTLEDGAGVLYTINVVHLRLVLHYSNGQPQLIPEKLVF